MVKYSAFLRALIQVIILLTAAVILSACGTGSQPGEPSTGDVYSGETTDSEVEIPSGVAPAISSLAGAAGANYQIVNERQAVLDLVNQARCASNLNPLVLNDKLSKAAELHSVDMAINEFFSHTSATTGSTPSQRITAQQYSWWTVGENIAAGYDTLEGVFEGWMASPGHKANILNPNFREMGLGHVVFDNPAARKLPNYVHWWTQTFGTQWSQKDTPANPTCDDLGL
ncbi:MAG: hypothetical protein IT326_08930 [Anaerolineae bacterium]|nr:hypothetical protein [Anaerolineae bacterium]